MKIPKIDWIEFDPKNPPPNLSDESNAYLVLVEDLGYLKDGHYDVPRYYLDTATAYGDYLDDFWNTTIDWDEGNNVHVIAYADLMVEVECLVVNKDNEKFKCPTCITIFTIPRKFEQIFFEISRRLGGRVDFRTRHNNTVFEIDEKNILINIRYGDEFKLDGIRCDYALFYGCSTKFYKTFCYLNKGKFTELNCIANLIDLVINKKGD